MNYVDVEARFWQTPEEQLAQAIIERAIFDLKDRSRHVRADARRWIASDNGDYPSFVALCDVLGLEVSATRRRVLGGLVQFVDRRKIYSRIVRPRAKVPADPKASHEYLGSKHCRECAQRYRKALEASAADRPPGHKYRGQYHCKACKSYYQRQWRNGEPAKREAI